MEQKSFTIKLANGENYRNVTREVQKIVSESRARNGLINVRVKHTTCSLILNEDEGGYVKDLLRRLERIAPRSQEEYTAGGLNYYRHDDFSLRFENLEDGAEERVNGHAHVRASFLTKGFTIDLVEGKLDLGTWEQILFFDFDDIGPRRECTISVSIMNDTGEEV